jgi:hypothetical protein
MCPAVADCHGKDSEACHQRQDVFRTMFRNRSVFKKGEGKAERAYEDVTMILGFATKRSWYNRRSRTPFNFHDSRCSKTSNSAYTKPPLPEVLLASSKVLALENMSANSPASIF